MNGVGAALDTDADVQLMLAFQRGDEEAFVQLYRKYRDRMVNFARRLLGSSALGEEAAQEVFLKLYASGRRYRPKSRFSTFLYRIAVNHCANLRARHDSRFSRSEARIESMAMTSGAEPERTVRDRELREALRRALSTLPTRQAVALVLCHYEGLSYREAAEALGDSEASVKSSIHRARTALSRELSPWMQEKQEETHAVCSST